MRVLNVGRRIFLFLLAIGSGALWAAAQSGDVHIYKGRSTYSGNVLYTFDGRYVYKGRGTYSGNILYTTDVPVPLPVLYTVCYR